MRIVGQMRPLDLYKAFDDIMLRKKIFFVVLLKKNLNTDFNNRPPPSLPSRRIPFMVGRVGGHIVVTRFVKNAVFFLN